MAAKSPTAEQLQAATEATREFPSSTLDLVEGTRDHLREAVRAMMVLGDLDKTRRIIHLINDLDNDIIDYRTSMLAEIEQEEAAQISAQAGL